jgi:hypothetical protein
VGINLPFESSPFAEIIYDVVPVKDGNTRIIINKPKQEGVYPAVFFIQGLGCFLWKDWATMHIRKLWMAWFSKDTFLSELKKPVPEIHNRTRLFRIFSSG